MPLHEAGDTRQTCFHLQHFTCVSASLPAIQSLFEGEYDLLPRDHVVLSN